MLFLVTIVTLVAISVKGQTLLGASLIQGNINSWSKSVSYKGGASLYLHVDMDFGDPNEFKVFVGSKNCPIVSFDSDAGTLVCTIPPSSKNFDSSVEISVMSMLSDSSIGISPSVATTISYSLTSTP